MSHAHPLGVHLFECVCSHKPASEEIILDIRSEYMCMCGFDVIFRWLFSAARSKLVMSSLMQPHTATETQEIREPVIPESDYPPYSSEKIHVYLIIIKLCKEEKKIQK